MRRLLNFIARLMAPPRSRVSDSELMGLYLLGANRRGKRYSPEHLQARQRRNGKYSTQRERK